MRKTHLNGVQGAYEVAGMMLNLISADNQTAAGGVDAVVNFNFFF